MPDMKELFSRNYTLELANETVAAGAEAVRNSPYSLRYHITAPCGWINDPNGLVRIDGRYHVFYQHFPYASHWGPMHWGHVTSEDLAHWHHEPVALAPDKPYEKGCFSGSAVNDNGTLTILYTADHPDNPIRETQCLVRSFDGGKTFVKSDLNPVIPCYPEGCTADFRDPKVWKQDGRWQMVCGTSHNGNGCVVLYTSDDLEHWEYRGIMAESDGTMGFMWECPNFCRVDGQDILMISPMGMEGHKNIAIFGKFDCEAGRMTIDHWQDLDIGEHYYACQVMEDGDRTILFSWMNMWDTPDPSKEHGWCGALTVPRVLSVRDGKLLQSPVPELEALRGELLISGGCPNCVKKLSGDCVELKIGMTEGSFSLLSGETELLKVTVGGGQASFALANGKTVSAPLTLACENPGLHIFVDRSCIEVFVNGGEVSFTERVFPTEGAFAYRASGSINADAWTVKNAFEC